MSSSNAHSHHAMPLRVYLTVGIGLLILTALTIWVAAHDFGEWNIIIALAIAGVKALLVAFFFMHLFYDNKFYFFLFVMGVLFLALFIGFSMVDTLQRGDIYTEVAKPIKSQAALYDSLSATGGHHEEKMSPSDTAESTKSDTASIDSDHQ